MKNCTICQRPFLPADGRRKRCDECSGNDAAWARQHRAANGKRPATMLELTCSKCRKRKPTSEFFCNRTTATGYHSACKECFHRPAEQQYRAKVWTNYRLRPEDIDEMIEQQNGCCRICEDPITRETWKIDHDHSCDHEGKGQYCCRECVRGLLCHPCNIFAGYLEPRVHLLDKALAHIGRDNLAPGTSIRIPNV